MLARHRGHAGIVYCTSRREVDALAAWLCEIGIRARPYHAGLADQERAPESGCVPRRACRRGGGDGGVRHGHRSLRRPVRRPRRRAAVARALSAGIRPRRPRRAGSRVRADLFDRGLPEVARHAGAQRRADRRRAAACCATSSATPRRSDAATSSCWPISARPTRARTVARATSASTSSSRWASRRSWPARCCRAWRASGSGSAPAMSPTCCAAPKPSRSRRGGHGALTTFGLLRDASISEIRGYIEQLIAHRLLRQTEDEYPVLALTDTRRGAAQGSRRARRISRWRGSGARSAAKPRGARRIETESWQDVDRDLFERLRALRLDIARSRGVPPYVIFHDTTLREMARIKPHVGLGAARRPRRRRPQGRGSRRGVRGGDRRASLSGVVQLPVRTFMSLIADRQLEPGNWLLAKLSRVRAAGRRHLLLAEARQHLVAHRQVIDRRRDRDRRLLARPPR